MKTKTKKKTTTAKTKKKTTSKAKTSTKSKAKTKTKKNVEKTHILAIIDRSGSMDKVAKDAIGGFNTFLASQKKLKDKATMNVVLFSSHDRINPMYDDKMLDINDIQELNSTNYVPNGSTALNDAIVKSMTDLKLKINDMKPSQRPDKILCIIVTDGDENDSREYPKYKVDEVKKLILKRKEENWQFIFLCSTEDTALTGEALGFSKGNTFQYTNDSHGNEVMYAAVASAVSSYRSTSLKSKSFAKLSNNLLAEDDVDQPQTKNTVNDLSDMENSNA